VTDGTVTTLFYQDSGATNLVRSGLKLTQPAASLAPMRMNAREIDFSIFLRGTDPC